MKYIPLNEDFDGTDFFSRFTLDVLGKTIFNHEFERIEGKNDKYYQAYRRVLSVVTGATGILLTLSPWMEKVPLKSIREYLDSIDILVDFFNEMIEQHKDKDEDSILARLIKSVRVTSTSTTDDTVSISRHELLANLWLFFLAGHDTTAIALAWALNCLREYPDIQEKVYQEIHTTIGPDKIPSFEDLEKLVYLDLFIREVLRLHPPISNLLTRYAKEDLKYKDKIIPKGTRLGVFFPILQTNPDYWEDPLKFDPDRFLPENKKGRNHFIYLPFSAGPRECIGTQFSLVEQILFLARFIQKFKVVDPVNTRPMTMQTIMSLGRMKPSIVRFEKRI